MSFDRKNNRHNRTSQGLKVPAGLARITVKVLVHEPGGRVDEARAAGAWVRSRRLAAGMTQEELAAKCGLSVRAISNLERGRTARPHPRSLEMLAAALGLPETDGTAWAARLRADQARTASSQTSPEEGWSQPKTSPSGTDLGPPDESEADRPYAAPPPEQHERIEPAEPSTPQAAGPPRRAARRLRIALVPILLILAIVTVAALAATRTRGTDLRTLSPHGSTDSSAGHAQAQSGLPAVMLGIWTSAEDTGGYPTIPGQHPNIVSIYLYWGDGFPTAFADQAHSAGATPFVEIEPWQGGGPSDCGYGANFPAMTTIGANGPVISGYLKAFGSSIARFGHPVVVTFAHEFNVAGQYPWARGDCEGTTAAQWIKAWDTVRTDIDASAHGLAHFMWAPGADTGGSTVDPAPYWPGKAQVDMVGVEGYPDTQWGYQLGTFSGLFGQVFEEIHAKTSLPIFIAETNLAPLDGSGYQSVSGFISDLCSNGGDGVLQFQDEQTLSRAQWSELDKALASDCDNNAAPSRTFDAPARSQRLSLPPEIDLTDLGPPPVLFW